MNDNRLVFALVFAVITLSLITFLVVWRKKNCPSGSLYDFRYLFVMPLTIPLIIISFIQNHLYFYFFYLVITIFAFIFEIKLACFSIYIDENKVIKKTLFCKTIIDLNEDGVFCGFTIFDNRFYLIVSSDRKKVISLDMKIIDRKAKNTKLFMEKVIKQKNKNDVK